MSETILLNSLDNYYPDKVGIEIRHQNELNEREKEIIKTSGLDQLAELETWTALGTNQQLAYATHGIFRYFGKFPPPIATHLINEYTSKDDLVIDPMCGSGTTAIEAGILKRKCVVNDLNPLSVLISKVKTTKIDQELLAKKIEYIKSDYRPLSIEEYNFVPMALRNPEHWFLKETSDSLRGIKYLIEEETNDDIRNFMNVIFASTIRRVSRATTQQGRLFLDEATALEDAFSTFEKKYRKGQKGLLELPCISDVEYYNDDLKSLNTTKYEGKAKLVILHPPYFNSYKYSSVNSLEMGWLGYDRNQYNKKEIKEFFKVGKPENYERYVQDMEIALANALNMLAPDGVLCLMIGDTIMKGEYIQVTKSLIERLDFWKFEIIKVAIRVPKYTEATWVASQRRNSDQIGIVLPDYIVLIKNKRQKKCA